MATIKLKAFLRYRTGRVWEDAALEERFYLDSYGDNNEFTLVVSEQEFAVEVPDNYDPRAEQVAVLKAAREKLRAQFAKQVSELDEQINNLLAIEYVSEAA